MPLYSPNRGPLLVAYPSPTPSAFASRCIESDTSGSAARTGPIAASRATAIAVILKGLGLMFCRSPSASERPLASVVAGVVGPVDVLMAVHAAARERVGAGTGACEVRDVAAVAGRLVAFLAQERRAHLEQVGVRRAVRVVAQRAVLLHGLVRAHERPALLHVAHVAGVVDVVAHHHARADRAVRVVAIRAGHQALADRVARRAVDQRAYVLVAGEADVGLRELVAHRVARDVQLVAGRAGDVVALVSARFPVDARAPLVAGEADLVLLRRGHLGKAPRHRVRGILDVLARVAVAHQAAHAHRRARVGLGAVLAAPDHQRVGVAVRAVLPAADVFLGGFLGEGARRKEKKGTARREKRTQYRSPRPRLSLHHAPTRVADSCRGLYFIAQDAKLLDQGPMI